MAEQNITIRQRNVTGVYNKLFPKTTATQTKLSDETAALYGNGVADADAAIREIANSLRAVGSVQILVVDQLGNPIEGAHIVGLSGISTTDADGRVGGLVTKENITVESPFMELQDVTYNIRPYIGTLNTARITLPIQTEGYIYRVSSSRTVKFSKLTKSVDVCCVGGGGGGSGGYGYSGGATWTSNGWGGKGGGGGNIVSQTGITVNSNTEYELIVGDGGYGSQKNTYSRPSSGSQENANPGGTGGTTSFLGVEATGGTGGTTQPGISTNGGNGGGNDATGTEFDDGITYYSGGGGNGNAMKGGGSPYGGAGGARGSVGKDATGYGGGGGGGSGPNSSLSSPNNALTKGGNGGSGLVAIRFHFN